MSSGIVFNPNPSVTKPQKCKSMLFSEKIESIYLSVRPSHPFTHPSIHLSVCAYWPVTPFPSA